jgi:hypothetical protein
LLRELNTINSVEQIASLKHLKVRQIRFVSGFSFDTNMASAGTKYLLLKISFAVSRQGKRSLSNAGML